MQRCAFGCRDDVGSRSGPFRLRQRDLPRDAQGVGDFFHGGPGVGIGELIEIAVRDRNPEVTGTVVQLPQRWLERSFGEVRVVWIGALHRVVGERKVFDASCERSEVVEAADERKNCRPDSTGHRSV